MSSESPGLSKLLGTLLLHELSQSDDTLMTLRSECNRGHNLGFAHNYQAWPKTKGLITKNGHKWFHDVIFTREDFLGFHMVAFRTSHLGKSLTVEPVFAHGTLGNLKPLRSATC